jgi:hypothetical protein
MYLGTRRVRSAGRTAGSIEVTLPAQLQALEGVTCHLTVRDGARPEIVLQPDLSAAQAIFHTLWHHLCLGLGEPDAIGDFSVADYAMTLFPPRHWQERPPLAYADALAVLRQRSGQADGEPESLTRLLAFLAVAAAQRLNLHGVLALAFGDAVTYLMTGSSAGLGTDFERGMAQRIFTSAGCAQQPGRSLFDEQVWQRAQPGLRRVYHQFCAWQDHPQTYATAREMWYRALTLEMVAHVFPTEGYLERK